MRSAFGSIEKRGEGSWRIWWTSGGVRRSKTVHGSRQDAARELAKIQVDVAGIENDCKWSVYWDVRVEPSFAGLEAHTVIGYQKAWKLLKPYIGERWVTQTTARSVEDVLGKFEPGNAVKVARLWRKMCRMAVKDEMLLRDPFAMVRVRQPKKRDKELLDVTQVPAWMEAIEGIKYEPILLCELGGGLRHEEACALTWEDVEPWEYRGVTYAVLSVSKALTVAGGTKYLKEPKTALSGREVVLGEPFAGRLLALAEGKSGPMLSSGVKCEGVAAYSSPITLTHNLREWSEKHGVPYVRPAWLRSTFATLHGEAGSPGTLVSQAMGHADGTTRGQHYQLMTRRGGALIADNLAEHIRTMNAPNGQENRR